MNWISIVDSLTIISPLILSIGVIIGFLQKKNSGIAYRMIHLYLAIALIIDLLSRISFFRFPHSNLILLPILNLFEIGIFTRIYRNAFAGSRRMLITFFGVILMLGYLVMIILALFHRADPLHAFNLHASSMGILVFGFMYIFDKFYHPELSSVPFFRLNGLLISYFSIKLLFYIPVSFFIHIRSDVKFFFWLLYLFFTLIFYVFLIRFLWKNGLTTKQLHDGY